jgi:hypothetical protein
MDETFMCSGIATEGKKERVALRNDGSRSSILGLQFCDYGTVCEKKLLIYQYVKKKKENQFGTLNWTN